MGTVVQFSTRFQERISTPTNLNLLVHPASPGTAPEEILNQIPLAQSPGTASANLAQRVFDVLNTLPPRFAHMLEVEFRFLQTSPKLVYLPSAAADALRLLRKPS